MNVQEIYTKNAAVVYRYAMHMLNNKEQAEDVTSEVFTRLLKHQGDFQNHNNKKAWLLTITRNIIFDGYRKKRELLLPINEEGEYIEFADESKSVEESVFTAELIELIQKELSLLDQETSEVIVLRVWEQLQFGEIAKLVNESESTVKLRFYRGIDKIKNNITSQNKLIRVHSSALPIVLLGLGKIAGSSLYVPSASFVQSALGSLATVSAISATTTVAASAFTISNVAVAIISAAFITLGGIFVFSLPNNRAQNNSISEDELEIPEDKPNAETPRMPEVISNSPNGFSYVDFAECGVRMPKPLKTEAIENSTSYEWDVLSGSQSISLNRKQLNENGGFVALEQNMITVTCRLNEGSRSAIQILADMKLRFEEQPTLPGTDPFKFEATETTFNGKAAFSIKRTGGPGHSSGRNLIVIESDLIREIWFTNSFIQSENEGIFQEVRDNISFFQAVGLTNSNLPKDFTYAEFSECGMKIPIPPKTDKYYKVLNPGQSNSNIRQWLFSNKSAEPSFYKLNTYGDTDSAMAGIFLTDQNKTILGGGGAFGTITILCTGNIKNINLDQAVTEFSDAVVQLNTGSPSLSENKKYRIEVKEKTNFEGFDAYIVSIMGGEGEYFGGGYLFVTPKYIRLVRVTNDFDQFVTDTIILMKENLLFTDL